MKAIEIKLVVSRDSYISRLAGDGQLLRLEFRDQFSGCELRDAITGDVLVLPSNLMFKLVEVECSTNAEDYKIYTLYGQS